MVSWLHHREHDEGDDEGDATGDGGGCVQASMVAPHPTPTSCRARPSPHSARSRSSFVLTNNSFVILVLAFFLVLGLNEAVFYDRLERERERL